MENPRIDTKPYSELRRALQDPVYFAETYTALPKLTQTLKNFAEEESKGRVRLLRRERV